MSNNRLSVLGLGLALSLALGYSAPSVAEQTTLNFVSFGGAYAKSQVKSMIEPYQAKNPHVKINVIDYIGGLAEIKAQVEAENVTWQIVDVTPQSAIAGCDEGLLEPIDISSFPAGADGTPATDDFVSGALSQCGVGTISWSTVMAYNSEKVTGKPVTVADFWNTSKYPGKRGLRKSPQANIEWGLEASGVPRSKVYEVLAREGGVERALKSLDRIKGDVIWWEAGAHPPQLLADGEVAFSSAYNGRLYNAIVNEKQPIVLMWDTQVFDLDMFAIPKGAKNIPAVLDFLKFATSSKVQADQTNYISYGPTRKSATPMIAEHILPHLPTAPDNFKNALAYDFEWWADHLNEVTERFNAWLAK